MAFSCLISRPTMSRASRSVSLLSRAVTVADKPVAMALSPSPSTLQRHTASNPEQGQISGNCLEN